MRKDPLSIRFAKSEDRTPALLIVEDEVLIRLSVADYLRDCGFKVFEAADAGEALDILATETAVDHDIETFDRIDTDIDGARAAGLLRG